MKDRAREVLKMAEGNDAFGNEARRLIAASLDRRAARRRRMIYLVAFGVVVIAVILWIAL